MAPGLWPKKLEKHGSPAMQLNTAKFLNYQFDGTVCVCSFLCFCVIK